MVQFADPIVRGRYEGILILSGGLTIHNLRDRTCFDENNAADIYKQFDNAVIQAVQARDVSGLLILSTFPRDRLSSDLSMFSHRNPFFQAHEEG